MALRREREVEFSQPVRQIIFMIVSLVAVAGMSWFLYKPISTVFSANIYLNGLIFGVFVIGVVATFGAVTQLISSVSWIEGFASNRAGHEFVQPPGLLASLSALLRDSRARTSLTASSARTILDSVATRLDERRDVTRYLGNLLIFLGLLGTFWGLSNTVPAVVDTIRSLAPDQGGGTAAGAFDRLMTGLEGQLGGMGTAFASSLLGLAGSLVVGLLELFAGHAQNRFYRELEEWLSSITRIGVGGDGEGGDGAIASALVEQNAIQIESLAALLERGDDKRAAFEERLSALTESVSRLAANLAQQSEPAVADDGEAARRQIALLERIAESLATAGRTEPREADPEVRSHIRSIDRQLSRLLEDVAAGRQDAVAELRGDLHSLGRAILDLVERVDESRR